MISIHVPAWGTTTEAGEQEDGREISIHVPAWGTTSIRIPVPSVLNSISIHVPAWGTTDYCKKQVAHRVQLQSTFPRGERLFV